MKRFLLILFATIIIFQTDCFADENSEYKSGYFGVLPSIEKEFAYKKQNKTQVQNDNFSTDVPDENNLMSAPLDDSLFLDVILKKQKNSKYVNDIVKITQVLENFRQCVVSNCNIQQFNSNVNLVDLHTRRIEKLYSGTSDGKSKSYYALLNINYLAKVQGNLKYDANYYSKYMPLSNSIYSKTNIQKKDYELLKELDNTIFILRQLQ